MWEYHVGHGQLATFNHRIPAALVLGNEQALEVIPARALAETQQTNLAQRWRMLRIRWNRLPDTGVV
jgi:hypothetical protein